MWNEARRDRSARRASSCTIAPLRYYAAGWWGKMDFLRNWVGPLADASAIVTAAIAVWVWILIVYRSGARRREVEEYLRLELAGDEGDDKRGLRSINHLMANLCMTQEQIYQAVFSSKTIRTWVTTDRNGKAAGLMFQYEPNAVRLRKSERASAKQWAERIRRVSS